MWNCKSNIKFIAIIIILLSTLFILITFFLLKNSMFISINIPFLINDSFNFKISFILDWVSSLFSSTVIFITSIILLYRISYIPKTEHKQFILIIIIFVLSIIILINRNNLIFILLGWDGLGISSYILVILYQNPKSGSSGSITILTNRIGDILIIISISIIFISSSWEFFIVQINSNIIILLLVIASCTKSAQFPFSAWLPAAIAAPTPISALVHSSTLVTAGVFLIIRISRNLNNRTILILIIMSSRTAIYARLTACWEQDIKKIIAYSTLSQIAIIIFAISLRNRNLAFFHLITHALFKSIIFITAGIIIMNSSYQDIRHMGRIIKNCPIISSAIGISIIALIALPFISGFFSKDIILEIILKSSFIQILTILIISSVGITVTYSLRLIKITYKIYNKNKKDTTTIHYNFIEIPLLIISPISIITGACLSWITFPQQRFILPFYIKITILFILFITIIISINLNFKSIKFLKIGISAISIWFIHSISTKTPNKSINIFNKIINFDKNWQETYGPLISNLLLKTFTHKIIIILTSPIFILLLLTIPLLIISNILYLYSLNRAIYWR